MPLIRGTRLPKPSGIRRVIAAAGERINLVATREAILQTTFTGTDAYDRSASVEATLRIHLVKGEIFMPLAMTGYATARTSQDAVRGAIPPGTAPPAATATPTATTTATSTPTAARTARHTPTPIDTPTAVATPEARKALTPTREPCPTPELSHQVEPT